MVKNTHSKKRSSSRSKQTSKTQKPVNRFSIGFIVAVVILLLSLIYVLVQPKLSHSTAAPQTDSNLSNFQAQPYNQVRPLVRPNARPQVLLTPTNIKNVYNLGSSGTGSGTIAVIDAYNDPNIQNDLNVFDTQYHLASCTTTNNCLEVHPMFRHISTSQTWAVEDALDVEWAHAIAPSSKILLIEAVSSSGTDLVNAINYARTRSDVVAVSMSWGGNEFSTETNYESTFTSPYGAVFFAASGDNGHGTSWPAVSANVIGVGGTTVTTNNGSFVSEVAWAGSGGGVSSYINEPQRQITANLPNTNGKRATPDVSYDADPNSGFPVYDSIPYYGYAGWFQVGGTSAGSPQWAAIASLSNRSLTSDKLYTDAAHIPSANFRDIVSGNNGTCSLYCAATSGYDYVTGLGSPLSTSF